MLMSGFQRMQTIRDAISARCSVRQYRIDDVSPDTVRRLIGMAAMAPSAHNRQPWRFVVVRDADIKLRLADAMGVRLKSDRTRDGDDVASIERDVERSRIRISGAPVLLAICLTVEEMDRYPDERRNRAEFLMAVQSTAMAVQNLMIAASSEGLGTCWMCAPLFCPEVVRAALKLPGSWEPQALVTLGQPAALAKQKPRKPLDEVLVIAGLDPASHPR
jgi:coenzyme F420-0:L-glutamate ligase / coenzyme F420-1:gamma-L-glutamate ligase